MAHWLLLESPDSVIEILWDIALAFFALRLGLLYAALTFGSALGVALVLQRLHPHPLPLPSFLATTTTTATTAAAPLSALCAAHLPLLLLVASSAVWARYVVVKYGIPPVLAFRLAMGAAAAVGVMLVEAVAGLVVYEAGWKGVLGEWAMKGKSGWGVLGLFALMPALQMALERKGEGEKKKRGGGGQQERKSEKGSAVDVSEAERKETGGS